MYSVVLMMALTGGGDVPAGLFNHGCCGGNYGGCYGGGYGCCGGGHKHHRGHGCCGGNYGGCYGGGYGYSCCGGGHKHHRRHGCCGGGYGCSGYGYGCYGGCYGGGYGGFGGCMGCAGGMGGIGGIGGMGGIGSPIVPGNVVPGTVVPSTTTPKATPKQTSLENGAPATLVVTVPADARLSIDGEATTSTSTERVFVSPALEFGREYHYTLQAEFQKNGKTVKVNKDVAITAGQETRVNLGADTVAEVASR